MAWQFRDKASNLYRGINFTKKIVLFCVDFASAWTLLAVTQQFWTNTPVCQERVIYSKTQKTSWCGEGRSRRMPFGNLDHEPSESTSNFPFPFPPLSLLGERWGWWRCHQWGAFAWVFFYLKKLLVKIQKAHFGKFTKLENVAPKITGIFRPEMKLFCPMNILETQPGCYIFQFLSKVATSRI